MALDMNVRCDECRHQLGEGDSIYCDTCFGHLKNEIDDLKEELRIVRKNSNSFEEDAIRLQDELDDLMEKMKKEGG
jgi:predicted phage-related endonuclease